MIEPKLGVGAVCRFVDSLVCGCLMGIFFVIGGVRFSLGFAILDKGERGLIISRFSLERIFVRIGI